jgi:hypothetical protein
MASYLIILILQDLTSSKALVKAALAESASAVNQVSFLMPMCIDRLINSYISDESSFFS